MQAIEILEELYRFYSPSAQERDLLSWIASFLEKRGFDIFWQEYDPGRFNLYACRGDAPFLLATHVDVYYGGRPNRLLLKNGFFYGPGVVDVRGQIAALLSAVSRVEAPFALAFFSEEETSGAGSWHFESHREFRGAVVLEPTQLSIANLLAGDVEVRLTLEGLVRHGAFQKSAVNPISFSCKLLAKCEELVTSWGSDSRFCPPLSLMVGKIEGGETSYVVPGNCVIECSFPFAPPQTLRDVKREIVLLLESNEVHFEVLDENPAFAISEKETVVSLLKKAFCKAFDKEPVFSGMPSWTDATYLNLKGIPTVVFGAGDLALAHSPHEMLSIEDLSSLVEVLCQFAREYI